MLVNRGKEGITNDCSEQRGAKVGRDLDVDG